LNTSAASSKVNSARFNDSFKEEKTERDTGGSGGQGAEVPRFNDSFIRKRKQEALFYDSKSVISEIVSMTLKRR